MLRVMSARDVVALPMMKTSIFTRDKT